MQFDWPKDAAAGLPATDAAVAEGVVKRGEAKAVRDVVRVCGEIIASMRR
jgi:hypothetical protein